MPKTARDLVTSSMITAGIIGATETPEAQEIADGLDQLNSMIDSWQIEGLYPHTTIKETGVFNVGQNTYTIGSGGDIDTVKRPTRIRSFAYYDTELRYVIDEIAPNDFDNRYRNDSIQTSPQTFTYRNEFPLGTFNIYPKPDQAYTFEITYDFVNNALTLNDTIDLPSGYYSALEYGLAVILSGRYGKQLNPIIKQEADNRKHRLKNLNFKPNELKYDLVGRKRWDVYGDTYR